MRYIETEQRVVWSASDLKAAAECEFAWLRRLDAKLGRVDEVVEPEDEMLERAARMGDRHEARVLEAYRERFGSAVAEIPAARAGDPDAMAISLAATAAALHDPSARVVFQAAFSTSEFVGFADFLLRDEDGRWRVQDSKLARRAKVTALMQLAAYVDQLDRLGVARAGEVDLLLGDGTTSTHAVADLLPLFHVRRDRIRALIADRRLDLGAAGEAIAWADPRGDLRVVACGRCATCELEVVCTRDVLLVAGMRPVQRERLRAAGIRTIDDLAAARVPEGMNADVFERLSLQAQLQLASPAGVPSADPAAEAEAHPVPQYKVIDTFALRGIPAPDPGDIFFDFEGDPLYSEPAEPGRPSLWNLDYLFGWTDEHDQYTALWAHSFAEEKAALETFCDLVEQRRAAHPGMHVYHYAAYEVTHLTQMAARYGVRERQIDQWLRDELFVDLYPRVRQGLRIGSRSYSIKKLEPLYMGDEVRTSDVQQGGDSIGRYVEARSLRQDGHEDEARAILDDLADYNRYDCVSTRRLRDWLLDRAREAGVETGVVATPEERQVTAFEESPVARELEQRADLVEPSSETDAMALRLAAAAVDYHARENKIFWQGHFERLREPLHTWADTRNVIGVDAGRSEEEVLLTGPDGTGIRRRLTLRGDIAPGSTLRTGEVFLVYAKPIHVDLTLDSAMFLHAPHGARIVEVRDDGVVVEEAGFREDGRGRGWPAALPIAVAPAGPPSPKNPAAAIAEWAERLSRSLDLPADAVTDILRRVPPRTRSGEGIRTGEIVDAVTRTVADLDRSYVAVQGPPGTGKTYVGSHVIARLVAEHGFRIGVVAQSHRVIEQMLARVVEAGVPRDRVAKEARETAEPQFTALPKADRLAEFMAEQGDGGFVVGGTLWDFTNTNRVARGELDLLVIDEAGQFSLAATAAAGISARNLLLLGDPQQLPQVSQGTHPQPVDMSALGWVMEGEAVLPADRGFFLPASRRMHPAVAEVVSHLSYAGRLSPWDPAAQRAIDGVEPGLHPVPVRHAGNSTESPEEAAEVVRIARSLIGRAYTDIAHRNGGDSNGGGADACPPRPLTARDILVVAPYNAQKDAVERALAAAGLADVAVGTVDKFQGAEAAVSIVTLAASSGRDAPRGSDFLLLQNRLNVAISRAKVAAYLVHSPALLDELPHTAEGVARLSAFARLVGADRGE